MSDLLQFCFGSLDDGFAIVLGEVARVVCWGAIAGIASMLVYMRFSAQERIQLLSEKSTAAIKALNAHQGEFAEALPLMKASLFLSFQRLQVSLIPSLFSGVPVLLILFGLDGRFEQLQVLPWGPYWMRSWLAAFFLACALLAIGTKWILKIK